MSEWVKKRFWADAKVVAQPGGWTVTLDGRAVKTPLKAALVLPTEAFAEAVAREWDAVGEKIDPNAMPFTRAANAAIDKVTPQRAEVIDLLADYGGNDLLCYRAGWPEGLAARQQEVWDPILDWAADRFGGRLNTVIGVIPTAQDRKVLATMRAALEAMTPFQLTGAHDLISLSGSLVLAFAVIERAQPPETAWEASRIDEAWQIGEWGTDDEAEAAAAIKRADFLRAGEIYWLSAPD